MPPTDVLDQGTDNALVNVIKLPLPAISSARAVGPMKSVTKIMALRQVKQF